MGPDFYAKYGFYITHEPDIINNRYNITDEIKELITELYPDVQRGRKGIIKKLKRLCRRYPHIPQFKNYLSVVYSNTGNDYMAREVTHQILKEHPDYLFGKLNYASQLLEDGEPEKVLEVLSEDMELRSICPDRDTFHFKEVLVYGGVALHYALAIDQMESAEDILEFMKTVGPDEPETEEASIRYSQYLVEKAKQRFEEEKRHRRSVRSRSYDTHLQTTDEPSFRHTEIEWLYEHGLDIERDLIQQILALPQDTLVKDLETVLNDGIRRYEFFSSEENKYGGRYEEQPEMLLHALFLLAELKAEQSLPVILELLRQGEELLDFWFGYMGEMMEIAIPEAIYWTGEKQLATLKAFLEEPEMYYQSRKGVHSAISRIGIHQPDRRSEVIDVYGELYRFYLEKKDDDRVVDTRMISNMVWDCIDLKAVELEDHIRDLYRNNLVEPGTVGSLDDVLRAIQTKTLKFHELDYAVSSDIWSRYDRLNNFLYPDFDWDQMDEDSEFSEDSEFPVEEWWGSDPASALKDLPLPKENFLTGSSGTEHVNKIGRNDPCPCGSGRKYKHCCRTP